MGRVVQGLRYLFDRKAGATNTLVARWLFLRALGVIYFSAFLALVFQIRGMVGVQGVLPAGEYLEKVQGLGGARFWYAPTLFWSGSICSPVCANRSCNCLRTLGVPRSARTAHRGTVRRLLRSPRSSG